MDLYSKDVALTESGMISHDDIDAAVYSGIITHEQASAVKVFAAERARVGVVDADEPFKFLSGFRDVFIALGLTLLAVAFISVAAVTESDLLTSILAAITAWGMAELVAKRGRLALSSIIVSLGFVAGTALSAGLAMDPDWVPYDIIGSASPDTTAQFIDPGLAAALAAVAAGAGFYARFKVPFVLAGLAVAIISFLLTSLELVAPVWTADNRHFVVGILGLLTFLAAMRFDASDVARVTQRADCGFWLHLIAAPLIVHTIIGASGLSADADDALAIFALVAIITLVALIIDRRSMIVSSLVYAAATTLSTVSKLDGSYGSPIVITLFALAALVIGLGLLWPTLRRLVLTPFEKTRLANLVPPWRPHNMTGIHA